MTDENLHVLLDEAVGILRLCINSMGDPKHPDYCSRKAGMIKRAYEMLKEAMEIDG